MDTSTLFVILASLAAGAGISALYFTARDHRRQQAEANQRIDELQEQAAELAQQMEGLKPAMRKDRAHKDILGWAEQLLENIALEEQDEHFAAERRAFVKRLLMATIREERPATGAKK